MTCGLPYVNGPMHIAHLRTYVPADIYVRIQRKNGKDVLFICGSDTHGTPVTVKAEQLGTTPKAVVEKYHKHYVELYPRLGVEFTNFGSTDHPLNHHRTREIADKLIENGYIYAKKVSRPYCPQCQRFLPDRYLKGTCPHCGAEARGDECDQGCGRYLEPGELQNPTCILCDTPSEEIETQHYFLKLTAFKDFLREYLETLDGTDIARNYALKWLEGGLQDWNITRNIEWGIPFPGEDNLVFYVWFDAPIGYISSTEEWAEHTGGDWKYYWKGLGKLIHFIGGDIVYHHCLFWPSMLQGSGYSVPSAVVASGMVKVAGHVFSKSRGYVLWVKEDYFDKGLDPDALRYYIASYTGHSRDLDFNWRSYAEKVNKELVSSIGNYVYRSLLFAYRNYKTVPEGELDSILVDKVRDSIKAVIENADKYEFKKISDTILGLADTGNQYLQEREPWKTTDTDPEKTRETIYNALWLAKALAVIAEPVLPFMAEKIYRQLGVASKDLPFDEALKPLNPVHLEKPKPLFSQIDDELLEELEEALIVRISAASG